MRRAALLLVLAACSGSPSPQGTADGPIRFRVLSERQNAAFCRDAPDFAVARTEEEWIDVFDLQTACGPGDDVELPALDFGREVGVAAWWRREPCLGARVRTTSVERRGREVVVSAVSTRPPEVCAQALGQLESFLALERSERFDGTQHVRFVLDGTTVGSAS